MKNLTIGICNDHAGTELKNFLMDALKDEVKLFVNFGTDSNDSCDYPDFPYFTAAAGK